jgi:hypothetical protein
MEKITLSLAELLTLEAELNGFIRINPETEKQEVIVLGLLNEHLNLGTKYWMTSLGEKLAAKKKLVENLRDELIKKFGEEKNGSIGIETFLDEEKTKVNPKFVEFQDEWTELLSEKEEIEYNFISKEELNKIDSKSNYAFIYKTFIKD